MRNSPLVLDLFAASPSERWRRASEFPRAPLNKGYLMDQVGIGNKLDFTLEFDQTLLKKTIAELRAALAKLSGS